MEEMVEKIKLLRRKTNAGLADCKKALEANQMDLSHAETWLRKKGLLIAAKKAHRLASEGLVHSYIHGGGRIGVLLEVNSETDFVARNSDFKEMVNNIALHIAAANPLSLSEEDLPSEVKERERNFFKEKNKATNKKPEIIEKIVEGQMKKWLSENCLLDQKYVKNPEMTVKDYLNENIARIGENMVIRRFVRFELGEGIEKKKMNFAEEVSSQLKSPS